MQFKMDLFFSNFSQFFFILNLFGKKMKKKWKNRYFSFENCLANVRGVLDEWIFTFGLFRMGSRTFDFYYTKWCNSVSDSRHRSSCKRFKVHAKIMNATFPFCYFTKPFASNYLVYSAVSTVFTQIWEKFRLSDDFLNYVDDQKFDRLNFIEFSALPEHRWFFVWKM